MKKVAVILSGCGFKDGAEITEAVSALVNLSEAGYAYQCFAPDQNFEAVNHKTGAKDDSRNIMAEAARIARGDVKPLKELDAKAFDALVMPGGFGAATHLCTWAHKGAGCDVNPDVKRVIEGFFSAKKPIGAICIAPAVVARVLGDRKVTLTIGNDKETAQEIERTGAVHKACEVTGHVTDKANKVVTTPAYMYGNAKPHEVFRGIAGLVKEVVALI